MLESTRVFALKTINNSRKRVRLGNVLYDFLSPPKLHSLGASAGAKSSTLPLPHRLNVDRTCVSKERERDGYYRWEIKYLRSNFAALKHFSLSLLHTATEMNWFENGNVKGNVNEDIWVITTRGECVRERKGESNFTQQNFTGFTETTQKKMLPDMRRKRVRFSTLNQFI